MKIILKKILRKFRCLNLITVLEICNEAGFEASIIFVKIHKVLYRD